MNFLDDYIFYSSGNETPEPYLWWGGMSLLGHILGNKVHVEHGDYFRFSPSLYVCLVGEAGSGKNTALSVNMNIMIKHFPELLLSSSIQSREDIADLMAQPTCGKIWTNSHGGLEEYRPFYILNNEFASFLSQDKMKMVEFLTEVYDGKRFGTGFKTHRLADPTRQQYFDNPHVSLLAGAVPTWFMGSLKMDLFVGGLGRRMIIVNAQRTKIIPIPKKPPGADEAMRRVIEHLKIAHGYHAKITLSPAAKEWWISWYIAHSNEKPIDPILYQFHGTKNMQLLKVATVLLCCDLPFKQELEIIHLKKADDLLKSLEPTIIRLTSGIGRNELAGVGAEVIDFLNRIGGEIEWKKLRIQFRRYLNMPEFEQTINDFIKTEQIVMLDMMVLGVNRRVIMLPENYRNYIKVQSPNAVSPL